MRTKLLVSALFVILCLFASSGYSAEKTEHDKGSGLYSGLSETHIPIIQWRTENYIIRIDDLGHSRYRYAAWDSDEDQSEEPNLILTIGFYIRDGSGGNHHYEFVNDIYTYECHVVYIGTSESPPGYLRVFRNDECILDEPVIEVLYSDRWE